MNQIRGRLDSDAISLPQFASILVVDDQRFDRLRIVRLCAKLPFDTHVVAADSLSAMGDMLNKDKFDLVLLDFSLPDGDGLQAIKVIRAHPKNHTAAAIMVTGSEDAEIAVSALKLGCSDYITKEELSESSLSRAAINALQKSTLTVGLETQGQKRRQMQQVLQRFSKECAQEIKPVVSRMMRQMRDLKDVGPQSADDLAQKVNRIEKSCMRLWEFLDDLDAYNGSDLADKTYSGVTVAEALDLDQPKTASSTTEPARSNRPERQPKMAPKPPETKSPTIKTTERISVFGRKLK